MEKRRKQAESQRGRKSHCFRHNPGKACGKARYLCAKCLPSQFCLHAGLKRREKWSTAREEAANGIAIKPADKRDQRD